MAELSVFCEHFITHEELGSDDPWAGTYCKRFAGHDGAHSPLYADERAVALGSRETRRATEEDA